MRPDLIRDPDSRRPERRTRSALRLAGGLALGHRAAKDLAALLRVQSDHVWVDDRGGVHWQRF